MTGYVGRYAPSPTGALHIGNAFSALVTWAHARSAGGRLLLRIEDVDEQRRVAGATESITHSLAAMGLDFDAGPGALDDGTGPYTQSERYGIYDDALSRLRTSDKLFACSCSRKDIREAASAPHGQGLKYPGTCRARGLPLAGGVAWRLVVDPQQVRIDDEFAGEQDLHADAAGDIVLRRKDGLYAYHLAVVVDDAAMGVTNVVRGRDLLESAAVHATLYQALGAPVPKYAHHPVLVDGHGERFAKRRGDETLDAIFARGVTPEEIIGALAATLGAAEAGERLDAKAFLDRFARCRPLLAAPTLTFVAPWA